MIVMVSRRFSCSTEKFVHLQKQRQLQQVANMKNKGIRIYISMVQVNYFVNTFL